MYAAHIFSHMCVIRCMIHMSQNIRIVWYVHHTRHLTNVGDNVCWTKTTQHIHLIIDVRDDGVQHMCAPTGEICVCSINVILSLLWVTCVIPWIFRLKNILVGSSYLSSHLLIYHQHTVILLWSFNCNKFTVMSHNPMKQNVNPFWSLANTESHRHSWNIIEHDRLFATLYTIVVESKIHNMQPNLHFITKLTIGSRTPIQHNSHATTQLTKHSLPSNSHS